MHNNIDHTSNGHTCGSHPQHHVCQAKLEQYPIPLSEISTDKKIKNNNIQQFFTSKSYWDVISYIKEW